MQVTYQELPSDRRFGVELEVSKRLPRSIIGSILAEYDAGREIQVTPGLGSRGWAETRRNDYWHVKYDSTCGHQGKGKDYGWEVASYIGSGIADVSTIAGAAQRLGDSGVEVTRNCGLHVHVEAGDFSQENMGILLAHWIKAEDYLLYLCPFYRHENKYCRTLRGRYQLRGILYVEDNPHHFWLQMAPNDLHTHNNYDKKYTLNTVGYALGTILPYYDRKTVELRLPECRLEEEHVRNWVQLILHLVDFCKNRVAPSDLTPPVSVSDFLTILGLHGPKTDFPVLEEHLWRTKAWILQKLSKSSTAPARVRAEALELLAFISRI